VLTGVAVLLGLVVATVLLAWLSSPNAPDGAGPPPRAGAGELARVLRVVDGDTIVVSLDGRSERVRYIGMDAPELARPDEGLGAECGADAARAANEALVAGEEIRLQRDASDRDRFGRLLRHVWLGDTLVSEALVARGVAEARSYPPDTALDGRLSAAEDEARSAGAGIWDQCAASGSSPASANSRNWHSALASRI
jgi:micrococcal nuclease